MKPIKVLVLDLFSMADFFKRLEALPEYSLERTTSLHKCFIHLATSKPDIMVLPYIANENEPEYDLFTIAKINETPFLVIDREATSDKVIKSIRNGAKDFILTSISWEEFMKRMGRALEKYTKAPSPGEGLDSSGHAETRTGLEKILSILDRAKEVKAMPYTVTKVLALCSNPDSSVTDIVQPIKSDTALTSSILKQSNSVLYYRGAPKIQNLRDAIVRIGLKETKETCMVHAIYNSFDKKNKTFGFDRYQFWVHSLATGIIAKWLAMVLGYKRRDSALLAGVLHDLGKMIADDYFNAEYEEVIRLASTRKEILLHVENEILGINHSFIGGRIAEKWRFPETITYAIRNHHDNARAFLDGGANINLATIVFVSNHIAKSLMMGAGTNFFVSSIPDVIWPNLGFEKKIPADFLNHVHQQMQFYYDFLEIPSDSIFINPSKKMHDTRILMLSNSEIPNTFIRIYLENCQYQYDVGSIGEMPRKKYDLVLYDFSKELSPQEMEFMIKFATACKDTPALFVYDAASNILVIQKIHRASQTLSAPLDMFAFDQALKSYDPRARLFDTGQDNQLQYQEE